MNLIELINYLPAPLWTRWVTSEEGEIYAHSHEPFSFQGEMISSGKVFKLLTFPIEDQTLKISPPLENLFLPGRGWFAQDINGRIFRFSTYPVLMASGLWPGGTYVGELAISSRWMFPVFRS